MFGIDSIIFRGRLLWNSMPDLIKSASSVSFKEKTITGVESNARFEDNDYQHFMVSENRSCFL